MTCRHMKRLTRVRVSPSGQSRARLPLGRVPIRSDKIQRQPNSDEPRPADAGYSSCAQPVTGPAFPARAAMLFRLLSGSAAATQSDAGEARPKQPVGRAPPAGEPAASPSPLPVSPCLPRLGSPVILLSNFAVCGIVFSVRRRWARPIQDTFLVMSASLSRLMSRINPPVRQQLDLSGNFRPDGGRKLLAPLHLLD